MTIEGVVREGVFVRIASGVDLGKLGPLSPALYKKQIARERVLAALLLDHDRKPGNYLAVSPDVLLSMDHGMVNFRGTVDELSPVATNADLEAVMRQSVTHWRKRNPNMRFFEEQITIDDMMEAITDVKSFCENRPERIREILEPFFLREEAERSLSPGQLKANVSEKVNASLQVLTRRANVLEKVLRDCFGTLEEFKPIPLSQMKTPKERVPNYFTDSPMAEFVVAA